MKSKKLEDLYKLTPLQAEFVFETDRAPRTGLYVVQVACTLLGDLDMDAFSLAWRRVIERHPILRTSFHWKGLEKPVQAVHREVELPVTREDWRELSGEEQEARFGRLVKEDRLRGFQLDRAPLTRLVVVHLRGNPNEDGEVVYRFLWTVHHLLIDGWTSGLLLKEVALFYEAGIRGLSPDLPLARPFHDYISWLRSQDSEAAEKMWRKYLHGFSTPTPINGRAGGGGSKPAEVEYTELLHGVLHGRVSLALTSALQAFAKKQGLTFNTVAQAAWALVVRRLATGRTENVVFGTVVSGRPAAMSGVESMIGPFINVLPVRVSFPHDLSVTSWLRGLQEAAAESRQFEYTSLAEIRAWCGIPTGEPLFDSLFVFENYPVDAALLRPPAGAIQLRDFQLVEQWGYPLHMIMAPGSELQLDVLYDARRFTDADVNRIANWMRAALEAIIDVRLEGMADVCSKIEAL